MANTIRSNTFDATRANKAPKLLLGMVILSGLLGLSACQDADDSNTSAVNNESSNTATTTAYSSESAHSTSDNTTTANTTSTTADNQQLDPDYNAESVEVIEVETTNQSQLDPEGVSTTPQQPPSATNGVDQDATAKNSVPTSEIQVTDVEYQDSKGRSIYVTFKTSATSTLQADLRMPNGKRVLLTAPTGQGNNPTYHSTDGSIELVTHGGGASVDLFYNNKRTKFDAIETEAEVLKPQ